MRRSLPTITEGALAVLHAIAGHKTTNEDAAAFLVGIVRVPDHGLANRTGRIVDNRLLRHLNPFTIDRHPIPTGFVAFPGRAMPIGDVATQYATWPANALEPRADVVRDIGVLTIVKCSDRHGQDTDTDEHKYSDAKAHIGLLGSRSAYSRRTKTLYPR